MAPRRPVKVIESCRIGPPKGSITSTSAILPLTFFDLVWLPLPTPQLLYYYDFPQPLTQFTESFLPHIKHTLSLALSICYPLAGNLSWPHDSYKPIVKYIDGDSISFTVAESDANFYRLSSNNAKDPEELHPLVPHLPVSGSVVPVSAIQATVFPNSGICIGITIHHSIVDGRSLTHFMKIWASISRLGDAGNAGGESLSNESLPFLDRTVINDPNNIEKTYLKELVRFMGSKSESGSRILKLMDVKLEPDMVRATFELNPTNIWRIKDFILAQHEKTQPNRLSTFVAACAYAWVCLIKAEGKVIKSENPGMARLVVTVDCRARLDNPIPGTYFGNCVRGCVMTSERADLMRGDGVAVATELIKEAMSGLRKGVLGGVEHVLSNLLKLESRRAFAAAGLMGFGIYETDFGWGRPKKVELVSNDRTGALFMRESRDIDGGIEFDLVLHKQVMEAFAQEFYHGLQRSNL
ncbi:phenolic glucoside malonyltransferase 1-like [Macadamia integrifolia]|uniref:phenolic glucoside malonyltransferase 1-like n=1 Tax=Macadamia integrifolia TaxID=60698 RepID=UPI001C4F05A4|nr:phenolic glucoside malonyltransferase 1-like [Macadamia integrifolia]